MSKDPVSIVIVDDDSAVLTTAKLLLNQYFEEVFTLDSPEDIPNFLNNHAVQVVVLDMNFTPGQMSGKEGIRWLDFVKKECPGTAVIMITAYSDIDLAVEAVRRGAFDFVVKPWTNQKFMTTIRAAWKHSQVIGDLNRLEKTQQALNDHWTFPLKGIIGESPPMMRIKDLINRIGPTDADVLILGENGTGKGMLATEIHRLSERHKKPFIQVDMGAIPDTLFESELFGHEKGAFTGASSSRAGKFELAEGGTLFLDEIGNLPLVLQTKILAVLQNRRVCRIGSNREIPLNIRLICATNQPLFTMVESGEFREDLYYRINLIEIELPPLRSRKEDIPVLANHFIDVFSRKYRKKLSPLSSATVRFLQQYEWPGNIRELEHALERSVILTQTGHLKSDDFMLRSTRMSEETASGMAFKDLQHKAIISALEKHQGNITKAAREVGISRSSFYRHMKNYGL